MSCRTSTFSIPPGSGISPQKSPFWHIAPGGIKKRGPGRMYRNKAEMSTLSGRLNTGLRFTFSDFLRSASSSAPARQTVPKSGPAVPSLQEVITGLRVTVKPPCGWKMRKKYLRGMTEQHAKGNIQRFRCHRTLLPKLQKSGSCQEKTAVSPSRWRKIRLYLHILRDISGG